LREVSSDVLDAAILDRDGLLLATTISEPATAARFVAAATRLLEEADAHGRGAPPLAQLDAAPSGGSVLAVREQGRLVVATTRPDPTTGLVLYDLRRCLESLDEHAEPDPPPSPAARRPLPRNRPPRGGESAAWGARPLDARRGGRGGRRFAARSSVQARAR